MHSLTRYFVSRCLIGSVLVLPLACDALLGLNDYEPADSMGGAGSDADGGGGGTVTLPTCGDDARCVPEAPVGWQGPVALTAGPATACGDQWSAVDSPLVELVDAPAADCSCMCGPPQGETCPRAMSGMYSTAMCPTVPSGNGYADGCYSALSPPPTNVRSLQFSPQAPGGGACEASSAHELPAETTADRQLCQTGGSAEGCAVGQTCLPLPQNPLESRYCVYTPQEVACPGFGYSVPSVFYTGGVDDTRACSDCSCGPIAGSACGGLTTVYNSTGCSSVKAEIPHDDTCVDLPTPGFASIRVASSYTPGSCASLGGEPSGAVVGVDPLTVCCTPEVQ